MVDKIYLEGLERDRAGMDEPINSKNPGQLWNETLQRVIEKSGGLAILDDHGEVISSGDHFFNPEMKKKLEEELAEEIYRAKQILRESGGSII